MLNALFVLGNAGQGVDRSADLEMAVAKQADVEEVHAASFALRCDVAASRSMPLSWAA